MELGATDVAPEKRGSCWGCWLVTPGLMGMIRLH